MLPSLAGGAEEPPPQTAVKSVIAANIATAEEFVDNTQAFVTESVEQNRVRELIVNNLKPGYERFDLPVIEAILSNDFERRFVISKNSIVFESKDEYILARQGWRKSPTAVRELLYSIRGMETDEAGKTIYVVTRSTYKSKYFNPRFLESLVFEKINERWMLKRQVFVLLHPNKSDLHKVQIFVVNPCKITARKFQKMVIARGADAFVDKCLKSSHDWLLPLEERVSIMFVFREPPPIGAKITTELVYERTYGDFPFHFEYTVKNNDPYFLILNDVYSEDFDGEFLMRVYVNGKKVAQKRISS